jgi:uncharacterized protein YukE
MASHELPEPVTAVPGATVVDFPWSQASSALAALDQAANALNGQLGERADMQARLADWRGRYRDEFDETYDQLVSRASGIADSLIGLASSIVTGAEDAVSAQLAENGRAELEATTPTTTNVPVGP